VLEKFVIIINDSNTNSHKNLYDAAVIIHQNTATIFYFRLNLPDLFRPKMDLPERN